ncbi:MAG: ABC transporter substrate-binding protein [Streptosporangiaceae bacterium]|jgi:peptide/nickel transport system substrate-binding protein
MTRKKTSMIRVPKRVLGLVVAAIAVVGVAACGGGASNSGNSSSVASSLPTNGNVAVYAEQPGFIPNYIFPFTDAADYGTWNLDDVQELMYRPLYWFGVGTTTDINWSLSLGEQPVWSANSKTVTISLKSYKWSNGETVDATDVLFWMNMYKAEKDNFGGYVPGYFPDNVASVKAINSTTVQFNLTQAYNHNWFLYNEGPQITPMPDAWDRTASGPSNCATDESDCAAVYNYLIAQNKDIAGYASSPIWSVVDGPWKLKSFGTDGTVVMVRNPDYSGTNTLPKGVTGISEFKEVPFASQEAEYNVLKTGTSTVQVGYTPFDDITAPTSSPTTAGANPVSDYNLSPWYLYGIDYFPINFNNPTVGAIFKQLYFRQALAYSIDTAAITKNVFHGYALNSTQGVPTYGSGSLLAPGLQSAQFPFSTTKAKALLTSNGWDTSTDPATCIKPGTASGDCGAGITKGEKLSFDLKYASGTNYLTTEFQALQSDAGLSGIQLNLSEQAGQEITAVDTICTPSKSTPCTWQMGDWGTGWVYAPDFYPSGEDLFLTGSVANYGNYSDSTNDSLIRATLAPTATTQTMYSWENYLAKQEPVVFMPLYPFQLTEVAANLHGVTPQNVYSFITPEDWYYQK